MMAEMMMGMQNLNARINSLEKPIVLDEPSPMADTVPEDAEEEAPSEQSFKMVYPWPAGRE